MTDSAPNALRNICDPAQRAATTKRFLEAIKDAGLSRVKWYLLKPRLFSTSSLNYYLSNYPQNDRMIETVQRDILEWMKEESRG